MKTGVLFQPELHNVKTDLVIIGGGPAGLYLSEAIQQYVGRKHRTILLEQKEQLGGCYDASLQQFRTFQGVEALSRTIARTVAWYEALSQEIFGGNSDNQSLIDRFPYLFLSDNQTAIQNLRAVLRLTQSWGFGATAEFLSSNAVSQRYPFIDGAVVGGLLYPHAGRLDFDRAMIEIINRATPNTTFALGTRMDQILVRRGKVVGVRTFKGEVVKTNRVVVATGPFLLKMLDQVPTGNPLGGRRIEDLFYVQHRQSFGAEIRGLPQQTKVFVIAPNGAYVRINTGIDGIGEGVYGYASSEDQHVPDPVWYPDVEDFEFPALVYELLGEVMSMYADVQKSPSVTINRRKPLFVRAGYYATSRDDLPIVSPTQVQGLYVLSGLEGIGIMAGMGAAQHMAEIIFVGEQPNNPYSIFRDFTTKKSGGIVL